MKSTAKQEQLHPQNVCGSLPRGVHNSAIWFAGCCEVDKHSSGLLFAEKLSSMSYVNTVT